MSEKIFTGSQAKAILHTGSDLLISAGAGSGKTYTLTERIIRKICAGADISKMLIVTFTKAAANELKARITKSLSSALAEKPDSKHLAEQIVRVGSADICTIDSFCLKIVRPNFDKLSIDSDFRIGDSAEVNILARETMDEVLDSFYESETENEDFLIVSDCYASLTDESTLSEELLKLYTSLMNTKEALNTLLLPVSVEDDFINSRYGQIIVTHIWRIFNHFRPIFETLISLVHREDDEKGRKKFLPCLGSCLDFIYMAEAAIKEGLSYERLKGVFELLELKSIGSHRYSGSIDGLFIASVRADFKAAVESVRDVYFASEPKDLAPAILQNQRICKAIFEILSKFDLEFKKKKRTYSICDFNDVERYALSLLYDENGGISEIARGIRDSYTEIYVDEYQDTNSVQDSIFSAISNNNRFMVGDIKQGVYRFRSAEPEIFSHYRQAFTDIDKESDEGSRGRSIFMSDNFRCDKNIIDFTNYVSDYMFFNSSGIPYEKKDHLIFSKREGGEGKSEPCEVFLIDTTRRDRSDKQEKEELRLAQPRFVARKIKELIDNGYLPNGKKIKPSDIAILLRKVKDKAEPYIDALTELGIETEYTSDASFFEKPHILLLTSILNTIDNPYRDVFLAGTLRSFIFGFSVDDLVKIKLSSTEKGLSLYSMLCDYPFSDELREKIDIFLEKMKNYRECVAKMSSSEVIAFILADSGILSSSTNSERRDLFKLYNYARGYESSSYKGLYSFLRYIEGLSSETSKETFAKNPENSVKIMSIHKSKGLEFEVCFIAGCELEFNKLDLRAPILFERNLGVSGYIGRKNGIAKFDTLMRKSTSLAIKNAMIEEEMRILYVAMTRARSKLYLTASIEKPSEKLLEYQRLYPYTTEYQLYSASSFASIILGACCMPSECFELSIIDALSQSELEHVDVKNEALDENEVSLYKQILGERFNFEYKYKYLEKKPSKLSVSRLYPKILDNTQNDEIKPELSSSLTPSFLSQRLSEASGAERGTATHVFMQFCDFEDLVNFGYERELSRLVDEFFISKENASLINKGHIEKFASSALISELISARKIYRELRFNVMLDAEEFTSDEELKNEKILVQGVIDCLYENEAGELILVDYKTDSVSYDSYEEVLKERHSTQLSYYKKACELIFERPVSKVLIYSVPLAKCVQL